MLRTVIKSKIHRATVTGADLDYEGSCSIDPELMRLADILPGEQVHVLNLTNGARAVTYAIEGGPGELGLNGAIAHLGAVGDLAIVITYAQYDDAELGRHVPRIVQVDARNRALPEAVTS
ncbi:MAG: aspartate 1-decarboxylase [Candidatus Dormibacteria bacterium]|jgi:aspartate 1-decarboxylase